MSVYNRLDNIPRQKLSSELPDEFTGKIVSITEDAKKQGQGAGQPVLKFVLDVEGEQVATSYRIPKALTGKGQYDMLMDNFAKIGYKKVSPALEGKTFLWKRITLQGAVQGNARHYPIKEIKAK